MANTEVVSKYRKTEKYNESHRKWYEKNKERLVEWRKNHYQKNKQKISAWNKEYYKRNPERKCIDSRINRMRRRIEWHEFFASLGLTKCCICSYDKCWRALEFHHIDPLEKEILISKIIDKKMTLKLQEEVKKCILLCSNCHKEWHYFDNWKTRGMV